ncbi:hypothetical protein [Mucisphaera calidilacus]|uniref:hypothetical protein n=1 Tax=Mucisphaera calidilacus TaxID=2527982 RepID=UPI0011A8633E|nr:hypothetical protein [Mucisphaera calidilacus]
MRPPWRTLFCLILLNLLLTTLTRAADEIPDARDYIRRIEQGIERICEQLPDYAEAARHAAPALIPDDRHLGVMGSDGLAHELSHRPGALALSSGEPGRTGEPVLYVFGVRPANAPPEPQFLQQQIDEATSLKGSGPLIGLASFAQLNHHDQLDNARAAVDILLDNGADDTNHDTPTLTVLNTLAAWTLQAELFAACVREGKIPVIIVSHELDRMQQRAAKYAGQRFMHDKWLDPIEPQQLGRRYLRKAELIIRDISTASWHAIDAAARKAGRARADGGTVYILAGARPASHHLGGKLADDPNVLVPFNQPRRQPLSSQDMIIAIGNHRPPGDPWWGSPHALSRAGRGVAWVYAGYGLDRRQRIHRRDLTIDTWAPVGDAILGIENLDARLGPISGVAGELVAWTLIAQIPAETEFLLNKRLDR